MNIRFLDTDEEERTVPIEEVAEIEAIGGGWCDVRLKKGHKVLIAVGTITILNGDQQT